MTEVLDGLALQDHGDKTDERVDLRKCDLKHHRYTDLELVRWTDPGLPSSLHELVSEAVQSGQEWVSNLENAWRQQPFLGQGEALFLVFDDIEIVAMAAVSADPFVEDSTIGRVRFVYVREMARRQGIAERLLDECLRLAEGNWRTLRLHTDNEVAARMYERRGFQQIAGDPRATHMMSTVL